jgi:hypothetical protein
MQSEGLKNDQGSDQTGQVGMRSLRKLAPALLGAADVILLTS